MPLLSRCIEDIRANKIQALDLSNRKLTSSELQAVCDVLRANTSITKIFLCDNSLNLEDTRRLVAAMAAQGRIEELRLKNTSLNTESVRHIAAFIKGSRSIREVNLYGNKINDTGASLIAHALVEHLSMTHLYLHWNNIGDGGAVTLAEMLRRNWRLERLDISGNFICQKGAEGILDSLSVNESVTSVVIGRGKAGDAVSEETLQNIDDACESNVETRERALNFSPSEGQKALKPTVAEELADRFKPEKWTAKLVEMKKAWEDVPEKDKPYFDFDTAFIQARQLALKNSGPKFKLKPPPKGP